jgi:choline dehydrogenase-like flavoprotein
MIFVIGSGPAGVSSALALLARGLEVTMLDFGFELEKDIQKKLNLFKHTGDRNILESFKYTLNSVNHTKLSYGSDYSTRQNKYVQFITDKLVYCQPSLAKGGLSNVWGAFIDSYDTADTATWPISSRQLESYYKKILEFMPLASNKDYDPDPAQFSYHPSNQASHLLNLLSNNKDKLYSKGFEYGSARLAVKFEDQLNCLCIYCGMCQYGCPNSLIYSSRYTLKKLKENKNFTYLNDIFVHKLQEKNSEVIIEAFKSNSEKKIRFNASQVFIACGSIFSTILILNSLEKYSEPLYLEDSQHFMFPCLLFKKIKNVDKENLHTLCQLYLKFQNSNILKKPCHLQIYTYINLYQKEIKRIFGKFYPFVKFFISPIISRLIVVQGFLHSQDSQKFSLQIKETSQNKILVEVSTVDNPETTLKIKQLMSYLFKCKKLLGFIPIKFLLKISKVGRSYHYGGSLQMKENPGTYETDIFGKINGFRRLNIVDSSIFTSIPAKSITFSIMANAYRIASECEIYEKT